MIIRQENVNDYKEVYKLITEAFETAEHADGNEQDLVVALRKGNAFIPELSLVAEENEQIVGHIMFTKMMVGNDEVIALAPLSVKPSFQRQGIGKALIAEGHRIAKELGYSYAVVLGSQTYYLKSGYSLAKDFGIKIPNGITEENYMAIKLQNDAKPISGAVTYANEFGI